MNRPVKIALIILTAALVCLVLAVGAVVLLVDPNHFKPLITAAVRQQTGRELTIDDDIHWSFYPVLGLSLGRTELANAKGFGDQPMVRIEQVAIGVELMPLLDSRLNIARLYLRQPQIHLAVNASGVSNWADILDYRQSLSQPTAPAKDSAAAKPAQPLQLMIAGVKIQDAEVSWNDASAQQNLELAELNLETGVILPGQPVAIELRSKISSQQPSAFAELALQTELSLGSDLQALSLSDSQLNLKAQLPEEKLAMDINASWRLKANLDKQQFEIDALTLSGEFNGEAIPAGQQTITLNAPLRVDLQQQTLTLHGARLSMAGAEITADIDGQSIIDQAHFQGQLQLRPLALRPFLKSLAISLPETAGGDVLKQLAMQSRFDATTDRVALSAINLKLDQSTITGELHSTLDTVKQIGFTLNMDQLNADHYLPPPPAEADGQSPTGPGTNNDQANPLALLDTMAIDGQLKVQALTVQHLALQNLQLTVKSSGRTLRIEPLTTSLYGGAAKLTATIDGSGPSPKTRAEVGLQGLLIGDFLDAYLQKAGPLEGRGDVNAQFELQGLDAESIFNSVTGTGTLHFADGAVRGVNIAQEIRNALALAQQKPQPEATLKTDFTELLIPFSISQGNLQWQQLSASSPLLRLASTGSFNLFTQSINTRVEAKVVPTLKGQGGEPLSELAGLLVPLKIKGSLTDPKVSVDLKAALAQGKLGQEKAELEEKAKAREQELREKAKQKEDEAKEKLNKELQRGFEKIFK